MATEKTPAHKRIKRAEAGRDEWKSKAIERREENERLKTLNSTYEAQLKKHEQQYKELQQELKKRDKMISEKEKEIERLKKNYD